ncbi:glycosyltransferase family 4 protein [Sphingomonas sp. PR090111-T3T-6A]|uniref:glycosyltransferase family 4 protein n=1 Tax=Sphingomonas sp. PR090111-T3T-6A TaxID=685778 RepID=UPI000376D389|nr:glycosyltransferase family 4 protein [Sphingomonas sp. PR090111-T3T-6A]
MEWRPRQDPAADNVQPGARRLHIAMVLAGLGAGGAERVVSLISGRWAEEGHRITIVAFDRGDAPVFHAIDPRIRLVRLGIKPGGGGRLAGAGSMLRRIAALRGTLAELAPDVTISFLTKINVLTLLANLGTGRRVIVSERNNPRMQQANRVWTMLLARLHWRADGIVMQTQASLGCLGSAARRRASVIPNPISVRPIERPPHDGHVLAATGRLTRQKGFDMLIDAFTLVAPLHPDWRLEIWGEGEDRSLLEDRIEQHRMADRISLRGNSRSPDEWVGQADAFVLSSRYEGFCNALGEAMAAGLPVAAFNCDFGPAEMIRPEEDGLLVPEADVPGLAGALGRLMGDEALRARLGEAAERSARRYRPEAIQQRWDDLLAGMGVR